MILVSIEAEGVVGDGAGWSQCRKQFFKRHIEYFVEAKVRQSEWVVSQNEEPLFRENLRDEIYMETV